MVKSKIIWFEFASYKRFWHFNARYFGVGSVYFMIWTHFRVHLKIENQITRVYEITFWSKLFLDCLQNGKRFVKSTITILLRPKLFAEIHAAICWYRNETDFVDLTRPWALCGRSISILSLIYPKWILCKNIPKCSIASHRLSRGHVISI